MSSNTIVRLVDGPENGRDACFSGRPSVYQPHQPAGETAGYYQAAKDGSGVMIWQSAETRGASGPYRR